MTTTVKSDKIGIGTLFWMAKKNGFKFPKKYELTDDGNAQRFADQHGHRVRWYEAENAWWFFDGRRWKKDDEKRVLGFARETAREIYREAANCVEDDRRTKLATHAKSSSSANKIEAMLRLVKSDLAITAAMFDRDNFKLNCLNGTLDLRTGELSLHQANDFITKLVSVNYEPQAEAPRFIQFLNKIFAGKQSLIEFVQQVLGYSMSGSVIEHKIFICYGLGQNGKSTLFNIVCEILNEYATETDPHLLLTKRHTGGGPSEEIYMLRGVRLATTIETNEDVRLDEARTKKLVSEDMILARPLHGHYAQFPPTHKLFMITNHKPHIRSQSLAMWRRIVLIPFNVIIPKDEKDLKFLDKLRTEKEGILAWLVSGYLAWQKNDGLPEQLDVTEATKTYKNEEDTLEKFIDECCQRVPSAQTSASVLFAEFYRWCEKNYAPKPDIAAFKNRMEEKGFTHKRTKKGNVWLGILLQEMERENVFSKYDNLDGI